MARNNGPGGKNRRKGKNMQSMHKRELRFKEELEEYALVEKMLGDERVLCTCSDGVSRVCHIRGKFRKRVWISTGDVVLIGLREFQESKADIIHKYNADEVSFLKTHNEIHFGADEDHPIDQEELRDHLFSATTDAPQPLHDNDVGGDTAIDVDTI